MTPRQLIVRYRRREAEAEAATGRPPRILRLEQASSAQPRPGFYIIVRDGRAMYAGQSTNVRQRMTGYAWYARVLGADPSRIVFRITYGTRQLTDERRRALERRLIRRTDARLQRAGLPPMVNRQREWEW